jgi:gas vesicle protein
MHDRTSIVIFLAGGVTGAAITLLLAPQSGSATRQRIRRTLRDTANSARDLTERVVERGEQIGDETAHRVQEAGSVLAGHRPRQARGNGDEVAAV